MKSVIDRRSFVGFGLGLGAGALTLNGGCATGPALGPTDPSDRAAQAALADLARLAASNALDGGDAPSPIPWLDKNGSNNQMPGPDQDPSSIFHFKGVVARANGFTGMGTDNRGRRIPFGTGSTDFSFMDGVYWGARVERPGSFTHT